MTDINAGAPDTGGASGISRRTVVKGVAWSVPAIVVGTAAPAMAASPPVFVDVFGQFCKHPGNSTGPCPFRTHLTLLWDNTSALPMTVTITSVVINGVTYTGGEILPSGAFVVPANADDFVYSLVVGPTPNSANAVVTVNYDYTDGTVAGTGSGSSGTGTARDTPPCQQVDIGCIIT